MTIQVVRGNAPIEGIIFDLDGTLYSMNMLFKPYMTLRMFPTPLFLPKFMKARKRLIGQGYHSRDELLMAFAHEVDKENFTLDTITEKIDNHFYPAFIDAMRFVRNSRPAVNDVLIHLRNSGIRSAVLSDFSHVSERLRKLSIPTRQFDYIGSSEDDYSLKPNVKSFDKIAQLWKMNPQNILVIGDRIDTDGAGAEKANMQFLQITDNKKKNPCGASWEEVKEFLLKL